MRRIALIVFVVACGGGTKKKVEEPPPVVEKKEAEPPPPAEQPAEPAVAKSYSAKAALTPLKGVKLEGGTVTFTQQDGQDTAVTSDFSGLKKGTYHVVIHDGSECGDNGSKAGGPFKLIQALTNPFIGPPEKGSRGCVRLMADPELATATATGGYYSAAKLNQSSKQSQDAEGQDRVYAQTERELRAHP